jgi:hypothetical protein
MERMKRELVVFAASVVLAAGLGPAPCIAQQPSPSAAAAPAQGALDEYTSGAIVRLALLDLRSIDDPKPRDYGVTLALLNAAQALSPNDVEIVRRRSEAAWNAADQDELLEATRRLVELDPKDTVATLRLLTARIGKLQTSDERMAKYEAFLGPKGQVLDPSIRSRLALDAAMLLKERGDQDGYLRMLKEAVLLDVTNKDAAFLALELYSQRVDDAKGRLELLSNLLMADPMDARVLIELRDVFASNGAYKAASRFHDLAASVLRATGSADDAELDLVSLNLKWRLEGPKPVLTLLEGQLASARREIERAAEANKRSGLAYSRRSEDVRLAISFEEARIGSLLALSDDAALYGSITDLGKSVQAQIDTLNDRVRRPQGVTDEQARVRIAQLTSIGMCWRALVGALAPGALRAPAPNASEMTVEPESAVLKPPTPPAPPPAPPPAEEPSTDPFVLGWRAIAAGDPATGLARLREVEDQEAPWVMMGIAVALEKSSSAQAVEAYRKLEAAAPLTVLGVIASTRASALSGSSGSGVGVGEAAGLEVFAKTIPSWIDTMVDKPWGFESLRVEPVTARIAAQDRAMTRVRIRNLAPIPLGMGTGRPINTRLLFSSVMETAGHVQAPDAEVVEVNRRLRLMPGEELECVVWPEAGTAGYAAEQACALPTRLFWRVIQGFEANGEDIRSAGPGCVKVQTSMVLQDALPEASLSAEELAKRITEADESQLPALLIGARVLLTKGDASGAGRVADAMAQRYSRWSPAGRMLALATLPPAAKVAALKDLDAQAAKETDPRVLLVAAVARPSGPDDPVLVGAGAAAVAANDMALAKVVSAQQARMRGGIKTYSQTGVPEKAAPAPSAPAPGPAAPTAGPAANGPNKPATPSTKP